MFNPKITPGPWEICCITSNIYDADDEFVSEVIGEENSLATAAVPELLEIYKAARGVLSSKSEDEDTKRLSELADTINTLEERHCERN